MNRIEISAEDFIAKFKVENVSLENLRVIGEVTFNNENFLSINVYLKNIEFDKNVNFNNIEIYNAYKIIFEDVIFKYLKIEKFIFMNRFISIFELKKCNIDYLGIIGGNMGDKFHIKNFRISKSNIKNIRIENASFYMLIISEIENCDLLIIENTNISHTLQFINSKNNIENVYIENISNVLDEFKDFDIEGNVIQGDINIQNVKANILNIKENDFKKILKITQSKFLKIYINNNSFNEFYIYLFTGNIQFELFNNVISNKLDVIGIKEIILKDFLIKCHINNTGVMNICDFDIDKFEISQDNNKANIYLKNVNFKELSIKDFSNYGNLTFSSCEAIAGDESIFSIENSNLGKAQFYDFDFTYFSTINIKNSVLTEIVTANVTWFLPEKLNEILPIEVVKEDFIWDFERDFDERDFSNNIFFLYGFMYFSFLVPNQAKPKKIPILETEPNLSLTKAEKKDAKYYKNQREVYRQLKQSTDKQGDRIQSLDFQAEEMKVYKESLKIDKKSSQNDRWILWISQSNNFGLSWWKPTCILLLCTLFFYISMVFSGKLFYMPFNPNWSGFGNMLYEIFWNNGSVFFQLFNPTRDISKVLKTENINGITHFLDISHRLIFGFFVFQIASGFRKYVK